MASLFDKAKAKLGLYGKSSGYFPELTTTAGPESKPKQNSTIGLPSKQRGKESLGRRIKRKRREAAERAAAEAAAAAAAAAAEAENQDALEVETVTPEGEAVQLPMDVVDDTLGPVTVTPEEEPVVPEEPISVTDLETATGGSVGETAVTAQSIYQASPETAMSEQEKLAKEELRRQRIKRARQKQSLIRKRLERKSEVGSGRRVLSGAEKELNIQTRQAGSGRRRGAGRRSLITGSTGGIGYYSRFL